MIEHVVGQITGGGEWSMDLIFLAVVFLVLALVFYIFGARGIAGFSMEIAKWLVIIFVIIAIITFLLGRL
ncbi:MAG: DUF1328 domain-containing protein [Methanomicrobiales archaeon]|nr:DUF1328 domain-containing protein [Methanomicrobiales archaeon]